jgi:DNA-binding transcriptional regulator YiaG
MTHTEIREIRQSLQLTQAQLGQAVGFDGRVVRRWEASPDVATSRPIPEAAARIIRLLNSGQLTVAQLLAVASEKE